MKVSKAVSIFLATGAAVLFAIWFLSIATDQGQKVVLCVRATNVCNEYKETEVQVAGGHGDGNCIIPPGQNEMCRPEFVLFQIRAVTPHLTKTCREQFGGVLTDWKTCTAHDGVHTLNPFTQKWDDPLSAE